MPTALNAAADGPDCTVCAIESVPVDALHPGSTDMLNDGVDWRYAYHWFVPASAALTDRRRSRSYPLDSSEWIDCATTTVVSSRTTNATASAMIMATPPSSSRSRVSIVVLLLR